MRRSRNAKILATLGPASSTLEVVEALFVAGADTFRLNFSHGTQADQKVRVDIIRQIERKHGRSIGILGDLQGPKLRVANFVDGKVHLRTAGLSASISIQRSAPNDASILPHPEIFAALQTGTEILLDDGRMRLRVERRGPDFAETVVIIGGELSNHKGVNVPNAVLPLSALTEKDKLDLTFALELGVDWVALSFVQRPEDVLEIKALVGDRARVMSKLEKPSAIEHLDAIIDLSDGIMVARGDLGVECPPESVPILQKRIVRAAREAGKPVVVATQMLEFDDSFPGPDQGRGLGRSNRRL